MITRKIDNKDTFQVVGEPEPIQLMFAKPKFANAFKNENLDKIMEFTKGRVAKGEEPFMTRRPTKDNPRRYFKLTQLIKTEEFGGKGGEGGQSQGTSYVGGDGGYVNGTSGYVAGGSGQTAGASHNQSQTFRNWHKARPPSIPLRGR